MDAAPTTSNLSTLRVLVVGPPLSACEVINPTLAWRYLAVVSGVVALVALGGATISTAASKQLLRSCYLGILLLVRWS